MFAAAGKARLDEFGEVVYYIRAIFVLFDGIGV
jgi:hypothetical protein